MKICPNVLLLSYNEQQLLLAMDDDGTLGPFNWCEHSPDDSEQIQIGLRLCESSNSCQSDVISVQDQYTCVFIIADIFFTESEKNPNLKRLICPDVCPGSSEASLPVCSWRDASLASVASADIFQWEGVI